MKTLCELISCTMTDWKRYIGAIQKVTGLSPTRELDKQKIPVGNPASYAMSLEVINSRTCNLSKAFRSLDFVHVTFLVYFEDSDQIQTFSNLLNITHITHTDKEGNIIFVGSVKQLRDIIEVGLTECIDNNDIYNVLDTMYAHLCGLGFKDVFGPKKAREDGRYQLS